MAAKHPYGFRPANPGARINYYPEAATQTFKTGDALINSSGSVAIAVYDSAEIIGVAAQPSSGTTGTMIAVYDDPDEVFIGRCDEADSLVAGSASDIIGSTGAMQLNGDGASTNVAVIVNAVDSSEADAVGKQFRFRWAKHALADTSS